MTKTISRDPGQRFERTCFQTAGPFQPRLDIKSDVALVYGITGNVDERIRSWREQGYLIHLMTGVAWGEYQDYFDGRWDGKSHEDEAQMDRNGRVIGHGPTVPYVAPSETYGRYLCVGVKRAIDAGAAAIHLEEPEFWVRGGYSGSFRREWQSYYGEPWIAPHESPDAQYRASKLKYFLYRRALGQVFDFTREYGKSLGRKIPCYVPTHSMINYAQWRIVSPEQSLVMLDGCDGYIGQVWTGTARTPNLYRGVLKERTFETAFLEYGSLQNLVRSTGRRMIYLNDPVEDNPDHSWEDYRRNWEGTLVASLMWPDVWRYEVTPWPERPFLHRYPVKDVTQRQPGENVERVGISPEYATELLTVFNALNEMKQTDLGWDCGTRGIGVLVSDTMMFQRGDPHPGDPHLSSFYGLALPLLKRGIPVHPVQYENIHLRNYLKPYQVLFLTYEGMKPPDPSLHDRLARWVKSGGALVVVDDDTDPYHAVREWWNSDGRRYSTPRLHLFERLGLRTDTTPGTHRIGKGAVVFLKESPARLAGSESGDKTITTLAKTAAAEAGLAWRETGSLLLRRGPYLIGAGLDESPGAPATAEGRFIDLFDPDLPVRTKIVLSPGKRGFYYDLARADRSRPRVLAAATKVLDFRSKDGVVRFHAEGPEATLASMRIALPGPPVSLSVEGVPDASVSPSWDAGSGTVFIRFPNSPDGRRVEIRFGKAG